MGEWADYYMDRKAHYMPKAEIHENFKGDSYVDMIWTTKSGEEIKIRDMTEQHLMNTIDLLDRKGFQNSYEYNRMVDELDNRVEE